MAKNKTTENAGNVLDFINIVGDETKKADCHQLLQLMEAQTGLNAKMWGTAIIGLGSYHYKYDSGHEGDAPLIGFSPRSNALTLYIATGFERREELLQKLGKYKQGKACIYIKKLADVNLEVLKDLIAESVSYMQQKYT